MCSSQSFDDIVYQRCKTAIFNGGAVFELDSGLTNLRTGASVNCEELDSR